MRRAMVAMLMTGALACGEADRPARYAGASHIRADPRDPGYGD